jgi:RND family efflux transporter MFP subunit
MKRLMMTGAALLAAWGGYLGLGYSGATEPTAGVAAPSVLVTAVPLQPGSLAQTLTAYGAIQSSPSAVLAIAAHANDTVQALFVHEGDRIPTGAPLLSLTPSAQTIATYKQAQSAAHDARAQVARTRKLLAQHLATVQDLANAQKTDTDAQSALEALKAQGGDSPVTLRAPFPAIVTRLAVSSGSSVTPGTAMIELTRVAGLVLRVGVIPDEARRVHPGDPVQITSLKNEPAQSGSVSRIAGAVDAASGLIPIDIALATDHLFPGETARAVITIGQARGYVVPHAAILADDQGAPYVVQADGTKARKVKVHIEAAQGNQVAVRGEGLNAHQALVLSGNYQLDDGMALRFADAGKGLTK